MKEVIFLLITTLFTAPHQDYSVARDTIDQSLKNRQEYRNVRVSLRVSNHMEFIKQEFEGCCIVQDNLVRTELLSGGFPKFERTYVKDGRFAWLVNTTPIQPEMMVIMKLPKGYYHSLTRNILTVVDIMYGVHDPWKVLEAVRDGYALELKGFEVKDGKRCLYLEGGHRAEEYAWVTDEETKKLLGKIKKARLWIYKSNLALARLELLDGVSKKPRFCMEFFDYETNLSLPEDTFVYTPPKGKPIQDVDGDAKKFYRHADVAAVPDLPASDRNLFDPVPDYSRMEIILHQDGTVETGGVRYSGEDGIYGLLYHAAHLYGRTSSADAAPYLSDIDMVVHAAPDVPQMHLRKIMMSAGCDPVFIYRFHIAVKDRKTGEKGSLPIFLPREVGGDKDDEEEPNPCRICIYEDQNGPFYSINTDFVTEDEVTCDSLEGLEKIMKQIRKQHPGIRFTVTLGGVPFEAEVSWPANMNDLVGAFNLLLKMGADTKSASYVDEIEELPVVVED